MFFDVITNWRTLFYLLWNRRSVYLFNLCTAARITNRTHRAMTTACSRSFARVAASASLAVTSLDFPYLFRLLETLLATLV